MVAEPIFKNIFGEDWKKLPEIMHKHYANRPYTRDIIIAEGVMDVWASSFMHLLNPVFKLCGILVPYSGRNIPTTVRFLSKLDSNAFYFDRIFKFPDKKLYHFRSSMIPVGGNEVIEYMNMGIGWHAAYSYENGKICLKHIDYVWRIFSLNIRIPLHCIFGKVYAYEEATGQESFRMVMSIKHYLFGEIYRYSGEFTIKEVVFEQ